MVHIGHLKYYYRDKVPFRFLLELSSLSIICPPYSCAMIAGSDFKDVQGRRELGRAQGQLVDAGPFLHINAKSAKLGEFREYCEVAWQGQIK